MKSLIFLAIGLREPPVDLMPCAKDCHVEVRSAPDLATAMSMVAQKAPDLIVTALELPDGTCLTFMQELSRACPVIVAAERASAGERIQAFELGADDVVVAPFGQHELALRMEKALNRWRRMRPDNLIRFADFALDAGARVLRREGRGQVALSTAERNLLELLLTKADRPTSRREITRRCLRGVFHERSRAPDMLASKLRSKLRELGPDVAVETLRGEGYRLRIGA